MPRSTYKPRPFPDMPPNAAVRVLFSNRSELTLVCPDGIPKFDCDHGVEVESTVAGFILRHGDHTYTVNALAENPEYAAAAFVKRCHDYDEDEYER